jgi:hypothetical protein
MALVMIKCPQTGNPVSTGIETDTETFARLPDATAHLLCPGCGQIHAWRKADAILINGSRRPDGLRDT